MTNEIRHMRNKIHTMEDSVIRCKNYAEAEDMRIILMKMRRELQKMEYTENKRNRG